MRDAGRFKSRTSARRHAAAIETDDCDDVKEAEHTEARTSLLICPSPTAVWKASTHVVIFVVLTMMHAFALLVFKLNEIDGEYPFSAASILVVVEGLKLVLATLLHRGELIAIGAPAGPIGFVASFRRTSTCSLVNATVTISAMYTVNNLLSFFCVRKMDPGTLSIAKSLVPYLTAVVLQFFGRPVNPLKWACIILQCSGVAATQYHGDSQSPTLYSFDMYMWLALSVVITTTSSVFNEQIIKNFEAPLQQINMIMYMAGVVLAAVVYAAVPAYHAKGFFEGYSPKVWLLICVQATYGLCVGYAYKYADVLIKNLSTSATLVVLVASSAALYGAPLTFTSSIGSIVILTTSYIYLGHANKIVSPEEKESCVWLRKIGSVGLASQELGSMQEENNSLRTPWSCICVRLRCCLVFVVIFTLALIFVATTSNPIASSVKGKSHFLPEYHLPLPPPSPPLPPPPSPPLPPSPLLPLLPLPPPPPDSLPPPSPPLPPPPSPPLPPPPPDSLLVIFTGRAARSCETAMGSMSRTFEFLQDEFEIDFVAYINTPGEAAYLSDYFPRIRVSMQGSQSGSAPESWRKNNVSPWVMDSLGAQVYQWSKAQRLAPRTLVEYDLVIRTRLDVEVWNSADLAGIIRSWRGRANVIGSFCKCHRHDLRAPPYGPKLPIMDLFYLGSGAIMQSLMTLYDRIESVKVPQSRDECYMYHDTRDAYECAVIRNVQAEFEVFSPDQHLDLCSSRKSEDTWGR